MPIIMLRQFLIRQAKETKDPVHVLLMIDIYQLSYSLSCLGGNRYCRGDCAGNEVSSNSLTHILLFLLCSFLVLNV